MNSITFQIREKENQLEKPYTYFDDKNFVDLFDRIRGSGKQIGIAIADIDYVPFFEDLGVDFYKVIRDDITNKDLLLNLFKTNKEIYISTGMASEKDILAFKIFATAKAEDFPHLNKSIKLVHTQLSNSLSDSNLKSLLEMKRYNFEVAYGHHCEDVLSIFLSLCYDPSSLFFYVKGEKDLQYPDDKHAVKISVVKSLIEKIKECEAAIGSGLKKKMINKIEKLQ